MISGGSFVSRDEPCLVRVTPGGEWDLLSGGVRAQTPPRLGAPPAEGFASKPPSCHTAHQIVLATDAWRRTVHSAATKRAMIEASTTPTSSMIWPVTLRSCRALIAPSAR